MHNVNPCGLSLHSLQDVRRGDFFQFLRRNRRNRTGNVAFFHRSVTDNDDLAQCLTLRQLNINRRSIADDDFLRIVTDIRNGQCRGGIGNRQFVMSINVGQSTNRSPFDNDAGSDQWLAFFARNRAFDGNGGGSRFFERQLFLNPFRNSIRQRCGGMGEVLRLALHRAEGGDEQQKTDIL